MRDEFKASFLALSSLLLYQLKYFSIWLSPLTLLCGVPLLCGFLLWKKRFLFYVLLIFLVLLFLSSSKNAFFYLLFFAGGSGIGAYILMRTKSAKKTILFHTMFLCAAFLLYEAAYEKSPYSSLEKNIVKGLIEYRERIAEDLRKQGIENEKVQRFEESWTESMKQIQCLAPSVIFCSALLLSYINYECTSVILSRIWCRKIPSFSTFSSWKFPEVYVWGFLIGWAIVLISKYIYIPFLYYVGVNLHFLFQIIYAVIGLAVLFFFLEKYKMPNFLKLLIFILIFPFLRILVFAGVFDVFFDFRRLKKVDEGHTT